MCISFPYNTRKKNTCKCDTEGFVLVASLYGLFWSPYSFIRSLIGRTRKIWSVIYIHAKLVYAYDTLACTCVCNHCNWTSLNYCSKMGLTSHLSCFYNTFSFYRVSFSLMTIRIMIYSMTIMAMMVLVPGSLVHALFNFLKFRWSCQWTIFLVASMEYFLLVESFYPGK